MIVVIVAAAVVVAVGVGGGTMMETWTMDQQPSMVVLQNVRRQPPHRSWAWTPFVATMDLWNGRKGNDNVL